MSLCDGNVSDWTTNPPNQSFYAAFLNNLYHPLLSQKCKCPQRSWASFYSHTSHFHYYNSLIACSSFGCIMEDVAYSCGLKPIHILISLCSFLAFHCYPAPIIIVIVIVKFESYNKVKTNHIACWITCSCLYLIGFNIATSSDTLYKVYIGNMVVYHLKPKLKLSIWSCASTSKHFNRGIAHCYPTNLWY